MVNQLDFWVGFAMGVASMATAAFVFYRNWRTEQELSATLAEALPDEKVDEIGGFVLKSSSKNTTLRFCFRNQNLTVDHAYCLENS